MGITLQGSQFDEYKKLLRGISCLQIDDHVKKLEVKILSFGVVSIMVEQTASTTV